MTVGVILEAFGYIESLDEVPEYLARIIRRQPTDEEVAELRERYESIGGPGPLAENTRRQARALQAALGDGYDVRLGMRNTPPHIPHVARELAESGVDRVVGIALAPQFSAMSVGRYHDAAREGLARAAEAPPARFVESYATHPDLVAYWRDALQGAIKGLPEAARAGARVIFTAHSLPSGILKKGDPYPDECRATSKAVADAAGVADWELAYQSGRPGWLAPDVLDAVDAAADGGATAVVLAPVGFVAEHLETLDDLDIEARERAEARGLAYARALAPGDDPRFIRALADAVRAHADGE